MIGQTIAHYRVTAKLGAGGMGEVYRATDTKLGRDVALKVLPEAFVADEQRMARFQREAQVLASLNHPYIAAIYGLEHQDKIQALAMELVEGPTLAERIAQGAIPIEEALPIAKQIAEALEYAHEKGIIHRDLKPANIKLTADGQVKVLDFGLAKALSDDASAQDASNSPTLSMAATKAGIILGTAAYMAPEQARGKAVDRRADIWSFGVVLYEMLTGHRLYTGETASDTLASVLKEQPDWKKLPAATPAAIRDLLRRCLTKEPRQRLQAIGDARIAIEQAISNPEPAAAAGAVGGRPAIPAWQRVVPWVIALVAVTLAGVALWRPAARKENPVARFAVALPGGTAFSVNVRPSIAISQDGQQLAFVLNQNGVDRVYVRRVDALEATAVPSTEGASHPFFSPDGQWLGFFAGGKLQKVRLSGGTPVALAAAIDSRGAVWLPDDTIVYSPIPISQLWRVSANGGAPQQFSKLQENRRERTHRWPCVLPGGKAVLFTVGTTDSAEFYDDSQIDAIVVATGERKKVLEGARMVQCVGASGHLIYAREGILFAVPFDAESLTTHGKSISLVQNVMGERTTGASNFALSSDGTLFYVPGNQGVQERALAWWDSAGKPTLLPAPLRTYVEPTLSPDGQRVAVGVTEGSSTDIWIYDLKRNTLSRLTFGPNNYAPIWSADGRRVIYRQDTDDGKMVLAWKAADGTGDEEVLLRGERRVFPNSVSPDGKWISLDVQDDVQILSDVFLLPLDGDRKLQPFVTGPFAEFLSSFSPDGRWIAYQSNETGRFEIYVKPFPSGSGRWQVSTEGGEEARWSPNGKELFYRIGTRYMAVPVETAATFRSGIPRVVVESGPANLGASSGKSYSVSPDGKRILTALNPPRKEQPQSQLVVTLNWAEETTRATAPK
jgi:serine/threonine-protein kinase